MEFLEANWLWILLGLGVVWVLLLRRGGMGRGMTEHGGQGSRTSSDVRAAMGPHDAHGAAESPEREAEATAPHQRHGCC